MLYCKATAGSYLRTLDACRRITDIFLSALCGISAANSYMHRLTGSWEYSYSHPASCMICAGAQRITICTAQRALALLGV